MIAERQGVAVGKPSGQGHAATIKVGAVATPEIDHPIFRLVLLVDQGMTARDAAIVDDDIIGVGAAKRAGGEHGPPLPRGVLEPDIGYIHHGTLNTITPKLVIRADAIIIPEAMKICLSLRGQARKSNDLLESSRAITPGSRYVGHRLPD
ncbi:MAG: hypothetical protein R3D67_12210 [Hyphomicrobiaceae bacterium]